VYRVWVNADESGCEDVYSTEVEVTVFPDISISAEPVGGSICDGGNFDLSVTASGSPDIHYQWEQQTDPTTWVMVGTDSPNYNTGVLSVTTVYRVWVNADESGCEDVYSQEVTVIITPDISITAQPVGGAICTGGNFDLSITASGSPNIHYEWQVFDGTDWSVTGTDSPNYNTGVLTTTTTYRVNVYAEESGCDDVYSSDVTVIVTPDISISAEPVGGSICVGGNFDLSITASGSPDIHYQWEQQTDPTTWVVVGTDAPNYNTGALSVTTVYRVWVNADESGCEDVYSTEVEVTVFPDISISAEPVGGSICVGGNFDLSVTASGSPDIHYQWEQQTDPTTWVVVGTDSPNYNTGTLSVTTVYRVWINADESGCEDVYSTTVSVILTPDISISAEPIGGLICTGGNFDLSVTASGSPDIHYQWEVFDGTDWVVTGTDSPSYNTGVLTLTTSYRVWVNADESGCEDVYSQDVTVIVTPDISISGQPVGGSICTGGTWAYSILASGSPNILYQWQDSTALGTWQNVSEAGGNTPAFITDPLTQTTWYRVFVYATESGCEDIYSTVSQVTVFPDISISSQPVGTDMCVGGTWTLSALASGSPNILYQWQDSTAVGTWQNVSETGGTTSSFTTDPLSVTTWYRLFVYAVENGCEDIYSTTVLVNVVNDPVLTTSGDQVLCIGGLLTMDVTVSGGVGTNTYQWQNFSAGNWVDVAGANNAAYTTVFTQLGSFQYRVIVTQGIGCQTVSAPLTVTVITTPDATITASATTICTGGTVTLTSLINGGSGAGTYQWQQFLAGVWTNVGMDNDTFITPVLTTGTYNYRLFYSQGSGCSDESNAVSIQVVNDPAVTISGTLTVCEGVAVVISSNVTGGAAPFTYHWQLLNAGNWSDVGSTPTTFNTGALNAGTWSYRLYLENASGCNAVSNTLVITAAAHPVVTVGSVNNPICVGGNLAQLTSTVTGGAGTTTYQWQYNNIISGAGWTNGSTSANWTISNLPLGTHEYRVIVTQTTGCVTMSDSYFMVVNPDATVTVAANNPAICLGGSSTITATVTGGSPAITYQWQSGPTSGGSWTSISGATSSTYAVPSGVTSSLWYRVLITDTSSGCADPASTAVQVTVLADPIVTAATMDDIYCFGESVAMSVTVTGGTGTALYQWQSFDGSVWTNVGTNSSTFDPGSLTPGNYEYRAVVTQNSGCEGLSNNIIFMVINYPTASLTSTPSSCGNNAGTITVTFSDDPLATTILISKDGGANYTPPIPDDSGSYTFTNLAPGSYQIWAKWATDECAIFIGNISVIELACGTVCGSVRDDTGLPISNVEIRLYIDTNNNDVYDVGEPLFGTTYTDGDTGNYCFEDVPSGEYVVLEIQPANYLSISDYDHSTTAPDTDGYAGANDPDNMIPATVTPGEVDQDNDFIEDPLLGSISGYVNDDGGAVMPGITIQLYHDTNNDGAPDGSVLATTTTNIMGYYLFAGVEPDHYVVVEINPPLYSDVSDYDHTTAPPDTDGDDTAQGPDGNIPVNLTPGENDNDNDFVDGRPGNICGNVSTDTGLPISSVEIRLYLDVNNNDSLDVADVLIQTTYTDGDTGDYCFEDITPGEYVVYEIQPLHFTSVSDYDHTTGAFDPDGLASANDPDDEIPVTLMPIESDMQNNFVEHAIPGIISGYVNDDAGTPLVGVTIKLYQDTNGDGVQDGSAIGTTTTNTSGYYSFSGVIPGLYVVVETNPVPYGDISDYDHTTTPPDTDGNDFAQGPDNNIPVLLMPEETDADNDFIDSRPGTICGNVSDDTSLPISSVEIRLYLDVNNNDSLDVADILVATSYTDSTSGDYCFEDQTPGEYVVLEIQPVNYNSISDYDHSTNASDPDGGAQAGDPDNEIQVTLAPAELDMDNDFIEDPFTGSITGLVEDEIGAPIVNVTIKLYLDTNADGIADGAAIDTTVTNSSGAYSFTGVEPGTYVVIETTPINYSSVSDYDHTTAPPDTDGNDSAQGPDDDIPVTLTPGEADADNNFVDGSPGSICGNVSDDTSLPISNVEIKLYLDVNNNDSLDVADILIATTYTDGSTGNYCFEDIVPGEYVIAETQPLFYNSISDYDHSTSVSDPDGGVLAGDPDNEIQVTLLPNEADTDNDFIEDPFQGIISGHIQDDAGNSLNAVQVKLYNDTNNDGNPDGVAIATTTTNSSGNYTFSAIEPGIYVVVETQPFYYNSISDYDWTTTPPDTDGDDSAQGPDNNIPVVLTPGETDADNNFVDGRPGVICGNVSDDTGLYISSVEIRLYIDTNNNGAYDAGDVLYATTYTDGDTGDYIFEDVTPGNYVIVEIQPVNYTSVSDYDHTTTPPDTDGDDSAEGWDNDIPVVLFPAEQDCGNDFIEDPIPGTITGRVENESGGAIPGVTISLYNDTNGDGYQDGSPIATTTTNSSGDYSFTGVEPGNYVLVETTLPGYSNISDYDHTTGPTDLDGNDSAQGADDNIPVKMLPGETDADNIFVDGNPGLICGSVHDDTGMAIGNVEVRLYTDVNNNDIFDAGDVLVSTQFTSVASGSYCFMGMIPGEYVIVEIQPANYNSVSDFDATTGAFDPDGVAGVNDPDDQIPVTLEPNELDADNNFIEDPLTGTISGYVLDDLNAGMPGIVVKLYNDTDGDGNEDGVAIATTTTNGSGYYSFTNIEPGLYVVVETSPLYYLDISDYDHTTTSPDTDGDDTAQGADNDIPVWLTPGESDEDNDFLEGRPGMICGNVSDNANHPISSVEVKLYLDVNNNDQYDAGDVLIATVFSDGDTGNYCFEDVTPGEYVVVETQPINYNSVSDYDETTSASDPDGDDQADGADDEIPVTLANGESDNDNNFIDSPVAGSISGYVLDDISAPIMSIKLYLYHDTDNDGNEDGLPIDSVYTNSSGYYQFSGIVPDHYVVVESQPLYYSSISDYDQSTAPPDTDGDDNISGPDNDIPVNLTPAEADADNNFIDGRPGSICGYIHDDLNNPMGNMSLQLYIDVNADGNIDAGDVMVSTTVTAMASGAYCFENVTPGFYVIGEVQLPGYGNMSDVDETPDPDGDDSADGPDDNIPVVLEPNESDMDNNFIDIGCPGLPTITGFPLDTICSGESVAFTAIDPGVGGVTYTWTFGSGSAPSTGTGLGPNNVVYTSNPTNSTIGATVNLTLTKAGCLPKTDSVAHILVNPVPSSTIDAATTNLCYWAPRVFKPLAAYVPGYTYTWNFGAGAETPTATGYGPHTVEYHTTGSKTVTLTISTNAAGSNCSSTSTLTFTVIQCLGNITGKVRTDAGVGIANVNVRLFPDNNLDGLSDGGSPIRNVNTSATGVYSMASLPPGQYVIVETQPAGYFSVMDLDETNDLDSLVYSDPNDNIIPVTVEPLEVDADNVFIESPAPGMITGSVFQDLDGDQIPDAGEGIANVLITLYHDDDNNGVADPGGFVTTATTNADGNYFFTNVTPANYVIIEEAVSGYLDVKDFDPSNDGDLVPNTNTNDNIIPVTVGNAETDANNYFIDIIGCPSVVTNTNDHGYGSLRYVIDCAAPGATITFAPSLWNQVIHLDSSRILIDKDIHIHSDLMTPRIMIYSDVPGAFIIQAGHNVEMYNIEITSGIAGMPGAGIENYGNLTIWEVCVFRNPLLPITEHVIYNVDGAILTVVGSCHIQN